MAMSELRTVAQPLVPDEVALSIGNFDPRQLLTMTEAASFLRISVSNLHKLVRAGTVRSVTIGVSRRVPLLSLHDYVDRLLSDSDGSATVTPPEYNQRA